MRQKTGLIQAIMHRPDVVFLDEPTSGLDPRAARTVRNSKTSESSLSDPECGTRRRRHVTGRRSRLVRGLPGGTATRFECC
jgi:hypothetical protein